MPDQPKACPRIVEGLEINAVSDGYVVHDPARDRIHYLNQTSAVIFELCTGEVSAQEMPRLLQLAFELGEPPIADVEACLVSLRQEGLIL
jgi:hypothetical protein